ncbi:hypothetical protein OEB94_13255 [Streptomyces sp. ICN988]|uniref:hypothetical protein n=1 Tax=Streptomyces sp. ICN988 TaxID=2983765 RepID=UPI0021E440B6|nr:hypothetical protein [Streptomyces sp. ICN988]MCV2460240.1 hypothetical protein [Streptomyces sp. ICN988]
MRILLIDCHFSLPDAHRVNFESAISCFDYDIIIWDIERTAASYREHGAQVPTDEGTLLRQAITRRTAEFKDIADMGRTIVVFPAMNDGLTINTGVRRKLPSGTVTSLVNVSLNDTLPFHFSLTPGRGSEIQPCGQYGPALWRSARDWLIYRGTLRQHPGQPAFTVKGTNKVVGSIDRTETGGWFFVLPEPWCERPYDEDFETPKRDAKDWVDAPAALTEWLTGITKETEQSKPSWADDYQFPESADRFARLSTLNTEMEKLLEEIEKVRAEQAEDDSWKILIYAQGEPLERRVAQAFQLFGFDLLEAVEGRADLRLSHEGRPAVVEVKGLTKSAAEKNAAQLEKWVSEEIEAGETQPKAILVANTWRETRPDERVETSFPNQMLKYAQDRGHCLVTGAQLLAMVRTVLHSPERAKDIAEQLLATVGTTTGWDANHFLARSKDEEHDS